MKKLVVMFPGVGYTMDCPLMYYASFLYEAKGYEQIHMKYNHILFEPDLTKEEKTELKPARKADITKAFPKVMKKVLKMEQQTFSTL